MSKIALSKYVFKKLKYLQFDSEIIENNNEVLKIFLKKDIIDIFGKDKIDIDDEKYFQTSKIRDYSGNNVLMIRINETSMHFKKGESNSIEFSEDELATYGFIKVMDDGTIKNRIVKKNNDSIVDTSYLIKIGSGITFELAKSIGDYPNKNETSIKLNKKEKINETDYDGLHTFNIKCDDLPQEIIDIEFNDGLNKNDPAYYYVNNIFNNMESIANTTLKNKEMSRKRINK